jgi:hypothetical protein
MTHNVVTSSEFYGLHDMINFFTISNFLTIASKTVFPIPLLTRKTMLQDSFRCKLLLHVIS